jgi:hypothetical protein
VQRPPTFCCPVLMLAHTHFTVAPPLTVGFASPVCCVGVCVCVRSRNQSLLGYLGTTAIDRSSVRTWSATSGTQRAGTSTHICGSTPVRSRTPANGRGASGRFHGLMSSLGTPAVTRVHGPTVVVNVTAVSYGVIICWPTPSFISTERPQTTLQIAEWSFHSYHQHVCGAQPCSLGRPVRSSLQAVEVSCLQRPTAARLGSITIDAHARTHAHTRASFLST